MQAQKFSIRSRAKSFRYAIAGIREFIRREHNARIHLLITLVVMGVACWLGVSKGEAVSLALVIGLVWITEMRNTCVERMADLITQEQHIGIKFIKDLAAAAVLVAAITAVIVGLIIFIPKFIHL